MNRDESTEEIEIICAWCNTVQGMKEVPLSDHPDLRGKPTHGLCQKCYDKIMKEKDDE